MHTKPILGDGKMKVYCCSAIYIAFCSVLLFTSCANAYMPRGVSLEKWEALNTEQRQVYIANLRDKSKNIKELSQKDEKPSCPAIGMVHAVGKNRAEARLRALDWAAAIEATHVLWEMQDLGHIPSKLIAESGSDFFILGIAYRCE